MKVTKDISTFYELWKNSWSGALETLEIVNKNDMEDDLMEYLEMIFEEDTDETTLNDYLWFERDEILTTLGIKE